MLARKKWQKKNSWFNWFTYGLSTALLITFAAVSSASPATDVVAVRLVIPPKLQAKVLVSAKSGVNQHTICIAGSGVDQFKVQNQLSGTQKSLDNITSYSQPYSVNTDQLKNCSEKMAMSVSSQSAVLNGSRIIIAAE